MVHGSKPQSQIKHPSQKSDGDGIPHPCIQSDSMTTTDWSLGRERASCFPRPAAVLISTLTCSQYFLFALPMNYQYFPLLIQVSYIRPMETWSCISYKPEVCIILTCFIINVTEYVKSVYFSSIARETHLNSFYWKYIKESLFVFNLCPRCIFHVY